MGAMSTFHDNGSNIYQILPELTHEQRVMVEWHITNNSLLGYGRGVGINGMFPVTRRSNKSPICIIDKTGNEQIASKWFHPL